MVAVMLPLLAACQAQVQSCMFSDFFPGPGQCRRGGQCPALPGSAPVTQLRHENGDVCDSSNSLLVQRESLDSRNTNLFIPKLVLDQHTVGTRGC